VVKLQVPNLSYISPKVVLNCPTNIWAASLAHYMCLVQSFNTVCEYNLVISHVSDEGGDMYVTEFPVPHPTANNH